MAILIEKTTNKFQVGEFAYGSWGYDQTNIDFYLVVRRTEKTIWLQPVKSQISEFWGHTAEYVVPTTKPLQNLHREYSESNGITIVENTLVDAPVQKFRIKNWDDGTEFISPRFGLIYPYDNKPKMATHTH